MFAPVRVVIKKNDTNKPIRVSSEMMLRPWGDDEAYYKDLWGKKKWSRSADSKWSKYQLTDFWRNVPFAVSINRRIFVYICSIFPRICVVCHSKISSPWNFVNIFIKSLKAIILIKWESEHFFLGINQRIFTNYFVFNNDAKKRGEVKLSFKI